MNLALLLIIVAATEVEHVKQLAPKYKAQVEVVLWDGSRCDMVTKTEAIEVDWAKKWPEAVGQSLYYGLILGKKPAILLLVKDPKTELRYLLRCQIVCAKHDIKLYIERVK